MTSKILSRLIVSGLAVAIVLFGVLGSVESQAQETMTFKIQVTTYAYGNLWYPPAAAMTIQADGKTDSFPADDAGRITFTVPVGTTSNWKLSLGRWEVNYRAEFNNGTLLLYDEGRNDFAQEYHLQPDGSYALEYYNDAIYVTNQSGPNAPILGWISKNASVGRRAMSNLDKVARWWSYVDPANPDYTIWMDWTLTGRGNFIGLLKVNTPENKQWNYHFQGLASTDSGALNIEAYHMTYAGDIDYRLSGTMTSNTTATATIVLPETGELNVVGTGWQVDPRGDGGGAEDHFGGGGPYSRLLGNQQVSAGINNAKANGTAYELNRTLPFSSNYSNPAALVVEWVRPGAAKKDGPDELALGGSGTLSSGITWQVNLAYNYLVSLVDFRRTLPASFISGLEPGIHTINYWLKDAEGRLSNIRSETIEVL